MADRRAPGDPSIGTDWQAAWTAANPGKPVPTISFDLDGWWEIAGDTLACMRAEDVIERTKWLRERSVAAVVAI